MRRGLLLILAPVPTGDILAFRSSVHPHRAGQFCRASSEFATWQVDLIRHSLMVDVLARRKEALLAKGTFRTSRGQVPVLGGSAETLLDLGNNARPIFGSACNFEFAAISHPKDYEMTVTLCPLKTPVAPT